MGNQDLVDKKVTKSITKSTKKMQGMIDLLTTYAPPGSLSIQVEKMLIGDNIVPTLIYTIRSGPIVVTEAPPGSVSPGVPLGRGRQQTVFRCLCPPR